MNLIETYIKEIHSEIAINHPELGSLVEVCMTTNCYGCVETRCRIFGQEEWEEVKEKGWWLG